MSGARFTLVRLVALMPTLEERIGRREIGMGLRAQLQRTARQVANMDADQRPEVHVLNTDGLSVEEAARRLLEIWSREPD